MLRTNAQPNWNIPGTTPTEPFTTRRLMMKPRYALILALLLTGILIGRGMALGPLEPEAAWEKLMEGNRHFVAEQPSHPNQDANRRNESSLEQRPFAAILGCADSRVAPEILFDQGLGDLFVVRVAGNTPDDFLMGSLEYAVAHLGIRLIVVLGHEECGAVQASLTRKIYPGHIETILNAIRQAPPLQTCERKQALSCAMEANVQYVVEKIKNDPPILSQEVAAGKVQVIGAYYDLQKGSVTRVK